jgi:hypothetical protein
MAARRALPRERPVTPDELDLDRAPQDRPRPSRPPWPAAVLVAVLGILAGTWLHSGLTDAAPTSPPRVSAWVGLDAVRLAEGPTAVLHLVVSSHDDAMVYLTSLDVAGAGVVAQHRQLWHPLAPGLVEDLRLNAGLSCTPGARTAALRLTLTATRSTAADRDTSAWSSPASSSPASSSPASSSPAWSSPAWSSPAWSSPASPSTASPSPPTTSAAPFSAGGGVTVTAVPGGRARLPWGLCQAGEQQFPQAYRSSATTRVVSMTDGSLTLALSDLPADARDLFAVQADGWFLPLLSRAPEVSGGAITLTLGAPQPQCHDTGTRAVLPTGLQLLYTSDDGSGVHEVYAPVGTSLAGWLLHARHRVCRQA